MSAAEPPRDATSAPAESGAAVAMTPVSARAVAHVAIESSGHGPPLVLLHGWAMHSGIWGPMVSHLARSHRVHAVDLPGHGRSAHPGLHAPRCTLDAMVSAVDSALAGETRPVSVLGWSMGGLVAMRWALAHPARVDRLVLACTTPRFVAGDGIDDDWPHAMSAPTLARFGDELHVAWKLTVQRFLALQVHNSEHGRTTLAAMREQLWARGEPERNVLAETLDMLTTTDLRREATCIAQPVLVIAGSRDTLAWPEAGRWLAGAIPRASYHEIEGAGHAPFLSHADEFLAVLGKFLGAR